MIHLSVLFSLVIFNLILDWPNFGLLTIGDQSERISSDLSTYCKGTTDVIESYRSKTYLPLHMMLSVFIPLIIVSGCGVLIIRHVHQRRETRRGRNNPGPQKDANSIAISEDEEIKRPPPLRKNDESEKVRENEKHETSLSKILGLATNSDNPENEAPNILTHANVSCISLDYVVSKGNRVLESDRVPKLHA